MLGSPDSLILKQFWLKIDASRFLANLMFTYQNFIYGLMLY